MTICSARWLSTFSQYSAGECASLLMPPRLSVIAGMPIEMG